MASVLVVWFLVALDRLIIATAIPAITDEFNSITDVGWYGSAYLLTSTSFLLLYCKIYSLFSIKTSFLVAIVLFASGSSFCGAARTSALFIFGRMISGLGAAGISMGAQVMMVHAVPIAQLPHWMGVTGAIFALASVVGPVVGGALTTYASWRWCFWMNLPVAAIVIAAILILFRNPSMPSDNMKLREKIAKFDVYGNLVLAPASICLVLALQWGGIKYAWADIKIIVLLVTSAALFTAFVLVQVRWPETATISPTILKQRSIFFGFLSQFFTGASQTLFVFYLPVWFQVVQGVSAVGSGTRILPLLGGLVTSSTVSGLLINKTGYYLIPMAFGAVCMSIGAGLLTNLRRDSPTSAWICYQVLYGWGTGLVVQPPMLAAKACLPKTDVSVGLGLMRFASNLGGLALLPPAAAILTDRLLARIGTLIPNSTSALLDSAGITNIMAHLSSEQKPIAIDAYTESLRDAFFLGLAASLLVLIGPLGMEWIDLKKRLEEEEDAEKARPQFKAKQTTDDVEAVPLESEKRAGENIEDGSTGSTGSLVLRLDKQNMEEREENYVSDDEPSVPLMSVR